MKCFFQKKWMLSPGQSLLAVFLASIILWALVGLITPQVYDPQFYFRVSFQNPLLILLNILPILFLMLTLFLATKHAPLAILITSCFFLNLAFVNRIKMEIRQDPFVPGDLRLIREMLGVIGDYGIGNILIVVGGAGLTVLLSVFVFLKWRRVSIRLMPQLLSLLLLFSSGALLMQTTYSSRTLYNSFPYEYGGKFAEYSGKGIVYSFLHDITQLTITPPPGYDPTQIRALEAVETGALPESTVFPHIIAVQSEAFSDISVRSDFDFTGFRDPLYYYWQIAEEALISGHISADAIGGGTAWTEFSFLTGLTPTDLTFGIPPYDFIRDEAGSMPRLLRGLGYHTAMLHPGHPWFYNRQNIFPLLGFEEVLFEQAFPPYVEYRGGYISEAAAFDLMLDQIEQHLETSTHPLFYFLITIQNHSPYGNKFYDGPHPENFRTGIELTEEERDIMANYFTGMMDADTQLMRLVEFMRTSDEPFVLVYYSDHMPSLSPTLFPTLGLGRRGGEWEELLGLYQIPYLIWANEAALEQTDILQNLAQANLDPNMPYSAFHLPAMLLELLGFVELCPFHSFLTTMRPHVPVINWYGYRNAQGEFVLDLEGEASEKAALYRRWVHYRLFDRGGAF